MPDTAIEIFTGSPTRPQLLSRIALSGMAPTGMVPAGMTLAGMTLGGMTLDRALRAGRRPAPGAWLARRLLAVSWRGGGVPAPESRRAVETTCRAELDWSAADWRRLVGALGAAGAFDEQAAWGRHPAERHRLVHEEAAARVLNALGHATTSAGYVRRLAATLRRQAAAGPDFALMAADARADLTAERARRRRAWRHYLAALSAYRAARAEVEGD